MDLNTAEILELPVAEIGPGPLVRTDRLDEAHAELLRPMLDEVPPVVVRETGKGWSLIDGQHRLSAAKLEERKTIRAVVVALDDAEALEAAVKANTSHGKALTLTERKAAAEQLIATTDWSDRRIAAACGLHRVTVGKARPDDAGGQKRPRVGRDGKTYEGESAAVRAARERREREAAEAGEPVDYGKCTAGFDCAAKATAADAMCDWHRKKANEASATDASPSVPDEPQQDPAPAAAQDPGKAGAPESRAAATGSTGASSAGAGDGGGTGDVLPTPPAETLPADWRDRIACAVHLLGCDVGLLRVALTDDDRIDLTDLRDHLDAVLAAPQEQTP